MNFQNRIKDFRVIKASELLDNPKNWRRHPETQRAALDQLLEQIGFAGAILVRESEAGLEIIDCHLRKDIARDAEVPVLITDLSEEEADLVLATYDPLGALAETDQHSLDLLLGDVSEKYGDELLRLLNLIDANEQLNQLVMPSGDEFGNDAIFVISFETTSTAKRDEMVATLAELGYEATVTVKR